MSNIWYVEPLTSTNPCQPEWATILTPTGIEPMTRVGVGSTIWTGKRWATIVRKEYTGRKQVNAYRTLGGTFYGTENHRIVQNGIKIEVRDARMIDSCGFGVEIPITSNEIL